MNDHILARYAKWERRRGAISRLEGFRPGSIAPRHWEQSDDNAVDLMHEAMNVIAEVQQCFTRYNEHMSGMAPAVSCSEAEAMYEAMQLVGADDVAESFMLDHAMSDDDEGDQHEVVYSSYGTQRPVGWKQRVVGTLE